MRSETAADINARYAEAVAALAQLERRAAQNELDIAALRQVLETLRKLRVKLGLV